MLTWSTRIISETWHLTLEMAPYVVLGLLAAILVFALFPKDRVQRLLGRTGWGSIVKAALAGIPLPLCSCGVLPTALSLNKRGASKGATVSFLVSTPETGLDSIAVTYALINPLMTILRPVAAFVSAVVTGLAVDKFGAKNGESQSDAGIACMVCGKSDCAVNHPWTARLKASASYITYDFFPDIANWIIIGLILSGVMAASLPADVFATASGTLQMALVIVVGIPMYICASASTPIAAVLLAKGMMPGAALVFLLVGPATNLMSLTVLSRMLGKRSAAIYLGGVIVSSLAIGLLVNVFLGGLDWSPRIANPEHSELLSPIHVAGVAVLGIAILNTWLRKWSARRRRHASASSPVQSPI